MCPPEVAEQLQAILPQLASDEIKGEVRPGKPIRLSGDDLVPQAQALQLSELQKLVRPIGTAPMPASFKIGDNFRPAVRPITDTTKPGRVVFKRPARKDI